MATTSFWTPERSAELSRRYSEDGAAALAKEWGITKNSVVGRANRLDLSGPPKSRGKARVTEATILISNPPGSCQWPHGDPRNPGFHFCGARSVDGKPYCATHERVAHPGTTTMEEPRG